MDVLINILAVIGLISIVRFLVNIYQYLGSEQFVHDVIEVEGEDVKELEEAIKKVIKNRKK